ncbi:MAG: zinc ABC transporter substrate-binding protein [Bacteroidales bacterium]|nr:zinc ABC transporter substrate-binding protein [Bacteroidales bacterium]
MRKIFSLLVIIIFFSCNRHNTDTGTKIITVSIAPFKYFVEEIAGKDFRVNVMVPPGSDPHIYEPYPEQIIKLRQSVAYISNGYLGFEQAWLDRFYQTNRTMKILSLGEKIDLIVPKHKHEGEQIESADPHYWVSLICAMIIAESVKELLCELNPGKIQNYETNFRNLLSKIREADEKARTLFAEVKNKSFMIYHPNLGYLARDYGLAEISVEYEGKEPPPSRLKELIDLAVKDNLKTIFVQREYDKKNATEIAHEIGADVVIIDPLSEYWLEETVDIIASLHQSFIKSTK